MLGMFPLLIRDQAAFSLAIIVCDRGSDGLLSGEEVYIREVGGYIHYKTRHDSR